MVRNGLLNLPAGLAIPPEFDADNVLPPHYIEEYLNPHQPLPPTLSYPLDFVLNYPVGTQQWNVRAEPIKTDNLIGTAKHGDRVTVIAARVIDGVEWLQVAGDAPGEARVWVVRSDISHERIRNAEPGVYLGWFPLPPRPNA